MSASPGPSAAAWKNQNKNEGPFAAEAQVRLNGTEVTWGQQRVRTKVKWGQLRGGTSRFIRC